jgi:hypothetical protein
VTGSGLPPFGMSVPTHFLHLADTLRRRRRECRRALRQSRHARDRVERVALADVAVAGKAQVPAGQSSCNQLPSRSLNT